MTKESKEKCIVRAISEDGFRWFKTGVVLKPDEDGFDSDGCARTCVVPNAEYNSICTFINNFNYHLIYVIFIVSEYLVARKIIP